MRCLFIRCRLDSALKLLKHDPQMKLSQPPNRPRRIWHRKGKKHSANLGSLAPIGSQEAFWPPRRRCQSLHSNYLLNRGYAHTTIISSKYHGQTLLLFANRNTPKIQKIYRALAQNIAQHDTYEILTPIGLVPHPLIGSVWAANPGGKPSKSLAKVISRSNSTTTFEVSLNSGRPHQIRIHLAFIGHPLVGDPLYGLAGQPLENLPGLPGDGGYFLHAQFLKFDHPITGEQINLEAALPSGSPLH